MGKLQNGSSRWLFNVEMNSVGMVYIVRPDFNPVHHEISD